MLVFNVLSQNRVQQRSSSSSHFPAGTLGDADEPGDWVFRTFPHF